MFDAKLEREKLPTIYFLGLNLSFLFDHNRIWNQSGVIATISNNIPNYGRTYVGFTRGCQ